MKTLNGSARTPTSLELLQISEERHRLLAEAANDVIWTMSAEGHITYVSPAVEHVRGFTQAEAMAQSPGEIVTPESAMISARYFDELQSALREGREPPGTFRCELEYLCKDGSTIVADVQTIPHFGPDGQLVEILGVSRDITEQKQAEAELMRSRQEALDAHDALERTIVELERMTKVDALTGVSNRRHFDMLLTDAAGAAARTGQPSSLVMFDVDRFKKINDVHGHRQGDRVLVEMARRVSRGLRATDALGRWGGEEFVVLVREALLGDAARVAEDIRQLVMETPFGTAGTVTVSLGVAEWHPGEDIDGWLARADAAMYMAKEAGRNVVARDGARPAPGCAASG